MLSFWLTRVSPIIDLSSLFGSCEFDSLSYTSAVPTNVQAIKVHKDGNVRRGHVNLRKTGWGRFVPFAPAFERVFGTCFLLSVQAVFPLCLLHPK